MLRCAECGKQYPIRAMMGFTVGGGQSGPEQKFVVCGRDVEKHKKFLKERGAVIPGSKRLKIMRRKCDVYDNRMHR